MECGHSRKFLIDDQCGKPEHRLCSICESRKDEKELERQLGLVKNERNLYKAALNAITKDAHQQYHHHEVRNVGDRSYQLGVADGHRCAASKAKDAFKEQTDKRGTSSKG